MNNFFIKSRKQTHNRGKPVQFVALIDRSKCSDLLVQKVTQSVIIAAARSALQMHPLAAYSP